MEDVKTKTSVQVTKTPETSPADYRNKAKRQLERVQFFERLVKQKAEQLDTKRKKAGARGITFDRDRVQGGQINFDYHLADLADGAKELDRLRAEALSFRQGVTALFDDMILAGEIDQEKALLLIARFCDGLTASACADMFFVSVKSVYRWQDEALLSVGRFLSKKGLF